MVIICAYTKEKVAEVTSKKELSTFIMKECRKSGNLIDGEKSALYRVWEREDKTFIDCGNVFYCNAEQFKNLM